MTTKHIFTLTGEWTGNRESVGQFVTRGLTSPLSVPAELGGPGIGTSPEELLLSAAAGCYIITLSTLLSNRKIPFLRIDLHSEVIVENEKGLRVDSILHRPTITVSEEVDEEQIKTYALHAEHACMVSTALRGNVIFSVHPTVKTQAVPNT